MNNNQDPKISESEDQHRKDSREEAQVKNLDLDDINTKKDSHTMPEKMNDITDVEYDNHPGGA